MQQSVYTTSRASGLVIHVTGDGLGSHSVFLNIFAVTEPLWDPRWHHARRVWRFPRVDMVVHQYGSSSGVSRDHSNRVHQVLIRQASIQTLCRKLDVCSRGKRQVLTEEETEMGERMPGVINVQSCPHDSRGQLKRFCMQILLSRQHRFHTFKLVWTYLLAVGHWCEEAVSLEYTSCVWDQPSQGTENTTQCRQVVPWARMQGLVRHQIKQIAWWGG